MYKQVNSKNHTAILSMSMIEMVVFNTGLSTAT